jgi:hypothetical protein
MQSRVNNSYLINYKNTTFFKHIRKKELVFTATSLVL